MERYASMALRLIEEGMGLGKAVRLVAATYKIDETQLYKYLADHHGY